MLSNAEFSSETKVKTQINTDRFGVNVQGVAETLSEQSGKQMFQVLQMACCDRILFYELSEHSFSYFPLC